MIKQGTVKDRSAFLLILTVIIMTGLVYARDLMGISISKYILLVAAVVPAFFMSYSSLIYFICFLFPIASGIPDNHIFPLLAVILLIKKPRAFSKEAVLCFVIISFFELVHYPFYKFGIMFPYVIGYLTTIFFVCYLSTLKEPVVQNKQCLLYFCIGLVVLLIGVLYITSVHGGVEMLLESSKRIGETKILTDADDSMMLNINSNGLGYFSIVGLSIVFILYYLQKIRFITLFILSAVYVYVGALSVSRTWLLSVVLMVVLLMIMIRRVHTTRNGFRYFLLIILVLLGGYVMIQNQLIYEAFFNRMTNETVAGGNGRAEVFQIYNQALIDNPIYFLFGAGAIHYGYVFNDISLSVHNGTQQIMVAYGIIGLVFFIFVTIRAFRINYRKGFKVCAIPFIVALFFVQSGQLLFPSFHLYPIIVSFIVLRLSDDDKTYVSTSNKNVI